MDSVTRGNITCLDCNQKFSREKALRVHLSKHHSMTFKEEKFYFDDYHGMYLKSTIFVLFS